VLEQGNARVIERQKVRLIYEYSGIELVEMLHRCEAPSSVGLYVTLRTLTLT